MSQQPTTTSILGPAENNIGVIFAEEVFELVTGSETTKAILSSELDGHKAAIAESVPTAQIEQHFIEQDIADIGLLNDFINSRTDMTAYVYTGGSGFVYAKSALPSDVNTDTIRLDTDNTRLNPKKRLDIRLNTNPPKGNQEANLQSPKYVITLRVEDVFHDVDSSRKQFDPTIGIMIKVYPDDSLEISSVKYSGEKPYEAMHHSYPSNHDVATHVEATVNALSRSD